MSKEAWGDLLAVLCFWVGVVAVIGAAFVLGLLGL
jgi:hypothetical protein